MGGNSPPRTPSPPLRRIGSCPRSHSPPLDHEANHSLLTPKLSDAHPRPPSAVEFKDGENEIPAYLARGSIVEASLAPNLWYCAEVIDVDDGRQTAFVHFLYYPASVSASLPLKSLAAFGTHMYREGGDFRVGQFVDYYSDRADAGWHSGIVEEVLPGSVDVSRLEFHDSLTVVRGSRVRFDRHASVVAGIAEFESRTRSRQSVLPSLARSAAGGARGSVSRVPLIARDAYTTALRRHSLEVASCDGDGNCLFRAVADQVYGDQGLHAVVRASAVRLMETQQSHFRAFMPDLEGRDWNAHIAAMRADAVWGDDPEVEALSRLYNRPVEIWMFDALEGAKRHPRAALGVALDAPPLRLSFYGGGHYDSIHGLDWGAHLLPRSSAGVTESQAIGAAAARVQRDLASAMQAAGTAAAVAAAGFGAAPGSTASGSASSVDEMNRVLQESQLQYEFDRNLAEALRVSSLAADGGLGRGGEGASGGAVGGVSGAIDDQTRQAIEARELQDALLSSEADADMAEAMTPAALEEQRQLDLAIAASREAAELSELESVLAASRAGVGDGGGAARSRAPVDVEDVEMAIALAMSMQR